MKEDVKMVSKTFVVVIDDKPSYIKASDIMEAICVALRDTNVSVVKCVDAYKCDGVSLMKFKVGDVYLNSTNEVELTITDIEGGTVEYSVKYIEDSIIAKRRRSLKGLSEVITRFGYTKKVERVIL